MAVNVETITDVGRLERLRERWDELALMRGSPFSTPAWQLAWWREARPSESSLRAIAVFEGDELTALAPFWCARVRGNVTHVSLLAAPAADGIEPLCPPGAEAAAAEAFAAAVDAAVPRPYVVTFRGLPPSSPWLAQLAENWHAGASPWVRAEPAVPSPKIATAGRSYADWLAERSSNTRQQLRRHRRRLAEQGAVYRRTQGEAEVPADVEAFAALHRGRWDFRGGSAVLSPGVERMLGLVAADLLGSGRFRLYAVELDGRAIAMQLVLEAGGTAAHWLGGFDDTWARYHPGIQALAAAIEESFEAGDAVFDLGGGGQVYKSALADRDAEIVTVSAIPRGRGFARARASLLPRHVRQAVATRLPEERKRQLVGLARRARGSGAADH